MIGIDVEDLDAVETLSAERNKAGAHCTVPHGTVVALVAEIRRLRAGKARAMLMLPPGYRDGTFAEGLESAMNELMEWRSGAAAGFGVITASPHSTLVDIGNRERDHHQEHHAREDALKTALHGACDMWRDSAIESAADVDALDRMFHRLRALANEET